MNTSRYSTRLLLFALIVCLSATAYAVDDVALWPSDALTKVMRSDGPDADSAQSLEVWGARREVVSAQAVFRPGRDVRAASVAMTNLRHVDADATIDAAMVRLQWVRYIDIDRNTSGIPAEELVVKAPASVPDPFWEPGAIALRANQAQPIWIELCVPDDARPGAYQGALTVRADGESFELPVRLRVWDFTVPAERHLSVINWWNFPGVGFQDVERYSRDGIHWEKPSFDVRPGTNEVLSHRQGDPASGGRYRDSSTVWLDQEDSDSRCRFKMFATSAVPQRWTLALRCSGDGIHWSEPVALSATTIGDRTTVHHNPFRKKWIFGLRIGQAGVGRARAYFEHSDAAAGTAQLAGAAVPWICADRLDPHHPDREYSHIEPQLYNHDAVAYESLMLGLFSIWQGPPNSECAKLKIQKRNEVLVGFSRDGFHWHRPDRTRFLTVDPTDGAWNWGNVQSAGGCCLIVRDRLYFYVSGRGLGDRFWDGNCSTGLATMRRDGFASMDAGNEPGTLTTRPVTFQGRFLFVNADASGGALRAEVLDPNGMAIEPYTRANCQPLSADTTIGQIRWKDADDLSSLSGRSVRLRFHLRNASFYSFWVSPDNSGASYGFVAAGGPGFAGPRDTVGKAVYEH